MSDWLEKVHAHADGELDTKDAAEVERLLAEDPRAAAEHQWAVYLRQTLRDKCAVPDFEHAWKAARERLDAIDAVSGSSRVERFVGRFSWGMAAVLLLVIVGAGVFNRSSGRQQVSEQQLAGLFTGAPFSQEQDVAGTREAERLMRQQLGADLPPIGPVYQVTHAAAGRIDGNPFMKLDLQDDTGRLALFVFVGVTSIQGFSPVAERGEYAERTVNGLTCIAWSEDQILYMVMAPRSTDEVLAIADGMTR